MDDGDITRFTHAGARASVYAATVANAGGADAAATGGYLDCNTKPVQPAALARQEGLGAWLWQWSAEQVSLPKEWDLAPAPAAKGA